MTLKEYVENPMGRGDSTLGQNRKLIVDTLKGKYESLTNRKEIKMKCYIAEMAIPKKYYIHLTIPSETERENTYDAIFEFTQDKDVPMTKWNVRVFSNSPSFAFTFAYVYLKHDLMIKGLAKKLGKEFMRKEPNIRNRYQVVSYEKYVFFGAMFILDSKILGEEAFRKKATSVPTTVYPGKVRTLEEIMKEYDSAKGKLERKKLKEKREQSGTHKEARKPQRIPGVTIIAKKKKVASHPAHSPKSHTQIKHIGKK